jgi:predicted nucleotidyltransferase
MSIEAIGMVSEFQKSSASIIRASLLIEQIILCLNRSILALSMALTAEMVIIFGSRVLGTPVAESDIDVVVISRYFAKISFLKRMPLLLKEIPFPKHVDYLCYTPEEFEKLKASSTIIIANDLLAETSRKLKIK